MARLPLVQELLRIPGRATELEVDDLQHLDAVAISLRPVLGGSCQVSTYAELTRFLDETMSKQDAT